MTTKLLIGIVIALGVLWWAASVYGWSKSASADCTRAFASITNENDTLSYSGFVKADGVDKATIVGTAAPHEVVEVEWLVPPNFFGIVTAYVELHNAAGLIQDSTTITKELDCREEITPTITPTGGVTPSLTPTATPSATLTPTQGPTATPGPGPSATPGPKAPEPTPTHDWRLDQVGWK